MNFMTAVVIDATIAKSWLIQSDRVVAQYVMFAKVSNLLLRSHRRGQIRIGGAVD